MIDIGNEAFILIAMICITAILSIWLDNHQHPRR